MEIASPMRIHRALGALLALLAAVTAGAAGADGPGAARPLDPLQALLGAWSWRNGCSRPDFTFRADALDFAFDADGVQGEHHFAPVRYRLQAPDEVIVHLAEPHGLSGTPEPDEFDIRLLDPARALILRHGKKHTLNMELQRCPDTGGVQAAPVHP